MRKGFLIDLLKGPGNEHWDLGRILAALSVISTIAGAIWNVLLGLPLELGPTGFPGGLGVVLGGCAALIYAKDRAKAENTVAKAVNTEANTSKTEAATDSRRQLKEK
jgi:hypothetical protein